MSNFLESWWSGKSSKKEEEVDVEQGREEEVDVEQGREEEGGGKEAEGWTMGLEGESSVKLQEPPAGIVFVVWKVILTMLLC